MNILDETSNKISDYDFLETCSDGPYNLTHAIGRLGQLTVEDIPEVLHNIKFAESVINGKIDDSDEGRSAREKFETMKKTAQATSGIFNSDFDNALKSRLTSYESRITDIKSAAEELSKKLVSLEDETKNNLWAT